MKVRVNSSYSQLERWGWTAVKATFVIVVLSLVLNPSSKGRSERASTGPETVFPAQIRPGDVYGVAAETGGRMAELHVHPGDTVQAGQLLGVVENAELDGLVERARRRMEIARARLSSPPAPAPRLLSQDPHHQWLNEQMAASERNLEASRLRLAQFTLDDTEKAYARAMGAAERVRELAARQLATAREVEDAERNLQNELANRNARREQRGRLQQELDAGQSQARMARLQLESARASATPASAAGDTGPAAALDYDDALAAWQTLAARKEALRLVALRPGTVLQVNAEPGAPVAGGAILFQIASMATLHFDVAAQATVARNVYPGQRVLVRVPVDPPFDVPATVSQVLLQPDPGQQAYRIRVTIPNPAPQSMLVGLEGGVSFPH